MTERQFVPAYHDPRPAPVTNEPDETGCDRCGAEVDWENAPIVVDGESRFLCARCVTRWLEWRDAR